MMISQEQLLTLIDQWYHGFSPDEVTRELHTHAHLTNEEEPVARAYLRFIEAMEATS